MYIVDHKVQNVQKQVVVTSDKPDVIEEICQELKQSKHRIAALVIFFIESNISLCEKVFGLGFTCYGNMLCFIYLLFI